MGKYIVGITGASGSIYAIRLIEALLKQNHEIFVTFTKAGLLVINQELDLNLLNFNTESEITHALKKYFPLEENYGNITYYDINHIGATIASGSFRTDGMIIIPCSMSTVSAIANGASNDLLERAADVILKEKKKLIVVPRETPLSQIHLQNLLILAQNNVQIVPPMPAFYHKPQTIDDLVNFTVGRILDQLGVEHELFNRWQGI
jgi:4-hydroxy-3-polyprenylbenzoate decarboxylase